MASQSTMDKLHDMRLSVMARAYRDQEELPAASGLSFDERLAMIVDAEWDSRKGTNKRLRHLRQAGFPEQDANIADVRYDDDRKLDRAQMVELSNCSWIASRRNIIVTGASGAGKTWISNALGVAACNAFYTVRYTRPELLDELTVFKDEEWLKQRKKYIKCDLLIIDDWLLEQVKPNEAREIMEVIEGEGHDRIAHPVLAVPAAGMAREPGQRGHCRRRRPRVCAVLHHPHCRRGIYAQADERNGIGANRRRAGGVETAPPDYRRCMEQASALWTYIIGVAWNSHRSGVLYAFIHYKNDDQFNDYDFSQNFKALNCGFLEECPTLSKETDRLMTW